MKNMTVKSGDIYNIVIAGITNHPGTADTNGITGGSTRFYNLSETFVHAIGGAGGLSIGNGGAGGLGSTIGGIGDLVYAGGNGGQGFSGGDSGAGGGGAGSQGPGGNAAGINPGLGTDQFGGDGGIGQVNNNNDGNPGSNYGGGGSGSKRTALGGAGAQGFLKITYLNDTISPNISINSPINNIKYNNSIQTLEINTSDNIEVDTIWFNWNGTNVTYNNPINITFPDGIHNLQVWVNDTTGNLNSTNITFTIDTTKPFINIISPINTTYNINSVLINISAIDNIELDKIWYNWNGTNITYINSTNITFNYGINTLQVWANDTLGNLNNTNVTFTIDILPEINIISPSNKVYNSSNIVLNISITNTNIDTIWYDWNGTNITYINPIELKFESGFNTIKVWANNTLGLISNSSKTFIVNPSPIINNLVLHLDADSVKETNDFEQITNWSDLSGNNNHALEWGGGVGNPIFRTGEMNNKPVVRFTTTQGLLVPDNSSLRFSNEFTIFAVINLNAKSTGTNDIRTIISKEANFNNRNYWLVHWDNRWNTRSSPGTPTITSDNESSLEPTILGYQATGTQFQMYVNGTLQSITQNYASIDTQSSPLGVGRQADNQRGWDGDIAEILVFNTSLNSTDRIVIEEYLREKWIANVNPITNINLISPQNNENILTINQIELVWNISNLLNETMECQIFVNSINIANQSCESNINNTYLLNVTRGKYNWSINVSNSGGFYLNSTNQNFNIIEQNHIKITKSITNENIETYFINTSFENFINRTQEIKIFEFVDNSLNAGSFTPAFDFINITTGPNYIGDIYIWDLNVFKLSQNHLNYSVTKNNNNWSISKNYIIGVE